MFCYNGSAVFKCINCFELSGLKLKFIEIFLVDAVFRLSRKVAQLASKLSNFKQRLFREHGR